MKKRLIDLAYKIGADLIFGVVAAVIVHFAAVGILPSLITRVTGLVGNTGTSIEVNVNEFLTGYDKHFDAEGYAQALAKQKEAEIERRQLITDNIRNSFSDLFSILNCFILLFGIRFIIAYVTGNYTSGNTKSQEQALKIDLSKILL